MATGYLTTGTGPDERRVAVGESIVVGRGGDNGFVIKDTAASRRHLEIRLSGDGFLCRDLGSRNGTIVNGKRSDRSQLNDGDTILVGETLMTFEIGKEQAYSPDKTVFLQTVLDSTGQVQEVPPSTSSKGLLEAAYTLMNALASNFNPCDLVDRVLETTTKAIRAQRGAVLFAGPDNRLQPCSVCGRVHTIEGGVVRSAGVEEISISESVARRVLRDGENVLYQSGWSDGPIDPSASMAVLKLTSILCVPIQSQNRILGILYMDTDIAQHEYTQEDMLLAAAAGNSAGLALENAQNHQALLEKQRMDDDIEAAWTIQESFLVSDWPTNDPRFEVYGMTRPAKVVGGDFYDFVRIDEDRVGILIGDVSGKGVPAALTMAQLLAEFRLCAPGAGSPAEVLRLLNERLAVRSRRGLFCTLAAIAINLTTGKIRGANAGHHPLLVVSKNGVDSIMGASGPPIGILTGLTWDDEDATLEPGDTMLLYTDGIAEARNGGTVAPGEIPESEFGSERIEAVSFAYSDVGPQELTEAVIRDVDRFCSPYPPHDDCTMIALRYLGNG